MYEVKIPKILFLGLSLSRYSKESDFLNTNDLVILANKYDSNLARIRSDKDTPKYLEDTRHGGLRGNFSTLLTKKGFIKRGNIIVNVYTIGLYYYGPTTKKTNGHIAGRLY